MYALTVDIFEPAGLGAQYPVVRHVFYGRTPEEARGYYEAHLRTDEFLRECATRSRWRDVACPSRLHVRRVG